LKKPIRFAGSAFLMSAISRGNKKPAGIAAGGLFEVAT
jgi:hypothetical protein